ncbi:ABC transporter ATP-binding protein [Petroclostridium sp. X23]|nr:ABC transporter ATP-binding protein [Petroclostridium sp. X23]WHH61762.1 ABC transporter ATP-binding protein [Petroclostridium sp. X23]
MFRLEKVKYKKILDIASLVIPGNKVTCVVGESGSGKTTLLRMLNKLISCDTGEIFFENMPLRDISSVELRRKIVMLSQTPAIFSGTVRDNLLIGLHFAEKPIVSDDLLLETLKMVHLMKPLDDEAEKLSGGEKQRLALGRVLLLNPDVFLLDEPSSALDEDTEHLIIDKMVAYAKKYNKTLIMVTHSKKIAQHFSDYIIEIKQGKVTSQKGA